MAIQQKTSFSTCCSLWKVQKKLKGIKKSSQEWILRQVRDPYVEKARMESYRCRSAFKLIEMDDKYKLLRPGKVIVDCGAAPGSWTQVAVKRCNANAEDLSSPVGVVLAIDILRIHPIPGALMLQNLDFTKSESHTSLSGALNGKKVDVFLSDMAPNACGEKQTDHEIIVEMAYHALGFTVQHCNYGGTFLVKIWDGARKLALMKDIEQRFDFVRSVKTPASRSDSAEVYLLGRGFKGLKP